MGLRFWDMFWLRKVQPWRCSGVHVEVVKHTDFQVYMSQCFFGLHTLLWRVIKPTMHACGIQLASFCGIHMESIHMFMARDLFLGKIRHVDIFEQSISTYIFHVCFWFMPEEYSEVTVFKYFWPYICTSMCYSSLQIVPGEWLEACCSRHPCPCLHLLQPSA